MKKVLVVVGGDAAGMSAASKAKRVNPDLDVIVFEMGEYISYSQCSLPYYISGVTPSKEKLISRTTEDFAKRDISVYLNHEVVEVDVKEKTVEVMNHENGEKFIRPYDYLMYATGANSQVPPIPGSDLENVMSLKTIPTADAIKEVAHRDEIQEVAIVGGGYIGLEMVETMVHLNKKVRIIQRSDQLMNVMDDEFGEIIRAELEKHGVSVHTGESLTELTGNGKVTGLKTDKGTYNADLVILALGVKPATELLKDSGAEFLRNGALVVDGFSRTTIPDVYAGGDCASIYHKIKKENVYLPLGTNANKQGRIAGGHIAGENQELKGVIGTSVLKVMDLSVGLTGLTEREAKEMNLNYDTVVVKSANHAGSYPGRKRITIKLVYEKESMVILGAQMLGEDGVAKRLDVFAVAIDQGMTTEELGFADLCYAPPFATVWDAVQVAANAAK
ncbi:CoA-disulfide reductase [Serpentinicella sp. ANB-PHB4]|uniref:CoA-disulfide reductase n=1 Tax=Serpentinicella sp. ANB-PHB4 TaxID=3074076 RepID=UPI0028605931|nr:CoA-disulfide reductase [Serpentinicella sp. ANB-PHB4]MDR5659760.1 CoA-disulfide reductase [Serpentinicella sp. ANB-PHB4]